MSTARRWESMSMGLMMVEVLRGGRVCLRRVVREKAGMAGKYVLYVVSLSNRKTQGQESKTWVSPGFSHYLCNHK